MTTYWEVTRVTTTTEVWVVAGPPEEKQAIIDFEPTVRNGQIGKPIHVNVHYDALKLRELS